MSCRVGRRCGSDLALLQLWCWLAATAPIWPLAWEPPCALGVTLKVEGEKQCRYYNKAAREDKLSGLLGSFSSFPETSQEPFLFLSLWRLVGLHLRCSEMSQWSLISLLGQVFTLGWVLYIWLLEMEPMAQTKVPFLHFKISHCLVAFRKMVNLH